jgi:hypothetical protein
VQTVQAPGASTTENVDPALQQLSKAIAMK